MAAKSASSAEKGKMLAIIKDLKKRMKELDELEKDLQHSEIKLSGSPKKSRELLEEIKVPSLELLKETSKK